MIVRSPVTLLLPRESPMAERRYDRDARLHRVRPGVYVRRAEWDALAPWERYLVRVHAVARVWTAPVFCFESAAVLHGLPIFGEPRDVHVMSLDGRAWRKGDVAVHGFLDGRSIISAGGYLVTSPLDTATDLCRVLPPAFALAVADAAMRRMPRGHTFDLHAHGADQASRRGLHQLAWVQARATPVSESSGESISRAAIEWLGFEEPSLQVEFPHTGGIDRPDFWWPEHRVIGEFDGFGKYRHGSVEETEKAVLAEKVRENRLRPKSAALVRWGWTDVLASAPLERALRGGGLTPCRPVSAAMLATLTSNPRSLPASTVPSRRYT